MTPELREKLLAFGNGAEPFLQDVYKRQTSRRCSTRTSS